ncbi:MAG: N-acetyltransferase family protein, partial [Synechococcales cyanobacterium]
MRNAEVSDLPTIVAIYNDTISSRMVTGDLQPVSVDSRKQWFYSHDPLVRPLWVVESESTVVGWLGFQSFYGRAAYQ